MSWNSARPSQPQILTAISTLTILLIAGTLLATPALCEAARSVDPRATTVGPTRSDPSEPALLDGFSPVDRWHLASAYGQAMQSMTHNDACRALFDELDLDGVAALSGTLYEQARGILARTRCRGSVAALTMVGGTRTRICESFENLGKRDQANLLIHEALHRAGLGEAPSTPEAPTAREISRMVKSACGL